MEDARGRLQTLKLITDIAEDAPALAALLDQVRQALPPHPGLLPVTEVGTSDEGVYLASPVLTAPSVEGRLRGGRQSLEAIMPWLRAVTAGVQAAHDAGVWHGAIHPRDVLVTDDGGVLTGVGVAPVLEHLKLQAPVRVPFTAPERASGRAWDARADQYSLAMLALDALSGRRLIAGTIPAFDRWTLAETPTEDARLHDVFVRALDPDPNRRYASVEEWLAVLAGPDRLGESGALSRFARDGVILAGPLGGSDGPREIKVQAIDDHKGDSLSLFPEEGTVESAVVESPQGRDAEAEPRDDVPPPEEQEQEWLVADVPDEATSVEPEAEPFAIRYAPAPVTPTSPGGDDAQPSNWRLDDHGAADTTDTTGMFAGTADESTSRRPWLLLAVMLVLVALGYGTWRSLQAPTAPASSSPAATDLSAIGEGTDAPAAEPASPAPSAAEPAERATPPSAPAPKAVPQAPVTAPPAAPATRPSTPIAPVEPPVAAPAPVGTGRVLIRSSPSGEVRVNGTVRGETPVVLRDLPFGVYAVAIARPGFESIEREITLLASQPVASLSVDLRRLGPGGPTQTATPSAPVAPSAAGPATAAPSTATARPASQPAPNEPAGAPAAPPAAAPAPQATGGIFVTSTPSRARLLVDGQPYGSTPASVPGLAVGAHTVRVEAPGYRPWEGRVAVLAGTRVRVTATLQQEQE